MSFDPISAIMLKEGRKIKTVMQLVWKIDAEYWQSPWTLWTVWEKTWERVTQEKTNKKKIPCAVLCYCNTFPFQHMCFLCIDMLTKAKKKNGFLDFF